MSAPATEARALRAEHDDLARQLHARASIDELRKAAYTGFAGLVAVGLSVKLAFDRWLSVRVDRFHGPPVYFFAALGLALLLLALAGRWALRSRGHMRREDALYVRFRALRAELGLDR